MCVLIVFSLLCKQMTFDFMSEMILSHPLPMPMKKKLEWKGHQVVYSKILRKIYKKKV